jgi:hypothetical protein
MTLVPVGGQGPMYSIAPSGTCVRNSASTVLKIWHVFIVHREAQANRSLGASWIVKAGEILSQALIPDHDKLALKAIALCIEVSPRKPANPRA